MVGANNNVEKQKDLATKMASELALRSKLNGPISELSEAKRCLLFAEVSMISYLPIEQCNIAAGKLGFTDGKYFNSDGSQAYWFQTEHDSVVVCRGTEADEWNDIRADVNALTAIAETVGKVHRGFKKEVDDLWPYLEQELADDTKPLWFTGHSLGGAMATICAYRCKLSFLKTEPEALYTYGSPRVGCKKYVSHTDLAHFRWVNNNDIVTRMPPVWMGYRHAGQERYLDRFGRIKDVSGWRRTSDRLQGFFTTLIKRFRLDQLSDHSIPSYIDQLFEVVRREEATGVSEIKSTLEKSPVERPDDTATTTTPAAATENDQVSA